MHENPRPHELRPLVDVPPERELLALVAERAANRFARSYSRLVVRAGQSTRLSPKRLYELRATLHDKRVWRIWRSPTTRSASSLIESLARG